ncbi:gamma-glutamylcyclotransferase (plasmid) [Pseudoalteromonas xiamenensis]|uniref:gamma-glutamylcyclotransferase family protein n=1 Tax=Pseudoalteromonas xiamenensis TaxID=882626 RepID=UPI0027E56BB5|nr:gamma-glutamylcyclotransferase family protein [Pseudoalteromonas xiamenensis]WMN61894.1 gamma-glutamylcyclotransferase [Pseudoalteromonas xiamenensis]
MPAHLFVYGTLLKKLNLPCYRYIQKVADFVGEAKTHGVLWDLGNYPGLQVDATAGAVMGELFKLKEPLDWHELDAYEDFHPNDLAGSLYLRIETQVLLANDKPQRAWVYHYQGPMHFAKVIEHGDYALHRQTLRFPRR